MLRGGKVFFQGPPGSRVSPGAGTGRGPPFKGVGRGAEGMSVALGAGVAPLDSWRSSWPPMPARRSLRPQGVTDGEVGNGIPVTDVSTQVANRYRIDARIGGGGMADVFEARDEALDRDVAIKLLRGIDDPAAARRFAEEIRLTARLNHPNVVQLFDAGEHEGSPFLVLERVTGGTLAQAMTSDGMDPQRVADIGRQIAAALEHAHGQGIVHRDVKPSNILLTSEGTVRLADFGIALTATATRLTVAGSVAGSAGYVSPEQVLGTGAGAASDVYALGLVLLECLTGAPPWSGTTVEVALARITADPPISESVPEPWQGLLAAMTARQPEHRPPMGVVAAALTELAAGRPTIPFAVPTPPPPAPPPRRLRVPAVVASALLLLAAAALVTLDGFPGTDAASDAVPTTVEPDGVIAASVVRGAAVGDATPEATAAAAAAAEERATRPVKKRARSEAKTLSGEGVTATADAPSASGAPASSAGAPRVSAPASQPAATGGTQERTRTTTTRETTDSTREPTTDSDTETSTDSGGTTDGTSDGEDTSTESDEDVADTTTGNNKNKGASKRRNPDITDPSATVGAGGALK